MNMNGDSDPSARPACGTKTRSAYDVPLHVAAIVLILVLSVFSCAFPIAVKRFPRLPIPHQFLFISRHFGTGVLIATAFVHLFPTAYTSLTDPCLPPFWNQRYPAMPGLIAMTSVFAVVGVEMFFATRGAGHKHDHGEYLSLDGDERNREGMYNGAQRNKQEENGHGQDHHGMALGSLPSNHQNGDLSNGHYGGGSKEDDMSDTDSILADDPFANPDLERGDEQLLSGRTSPTTPTYNKPRRDQGSTPILGHSHSHNPEINGETNLADAAAHSRALLQCLMLEAGILFHSIFIGMALSVATGPPFAVLLVAISFHQTFEGLALGSRISALNFSLGSPQPWLMALAYGTTTPAGQLLGLLLHRMYDPASETGLLVVGITNAVSSGLLLFAGLVELLAEDFLSEKSYQTLAGKKRLQACGSVVGGALLMALVGAWA